MHTIHRAIAVVILNYNNHKDTITCVTSVLSSVQTARWIFVVDNASTDDSLSQIQAWAQESDQPYTLLSSQQECPHAPDSRLIIFSSTENKGYAAGNNHGIGLALQWGADAVWILNNDTVVEKEALGAMQERLFSASRPGLCGSIVQYVDTGLVQCLGGGKTQPWTGLSQLFGHKLPLVDALQYTERQVEQNINFIYGASVMASREFIQTVGLMDERYFLYCEEQDWAYAAKGRFDLVYASKAHVHHKEGSTTGFSGKKMSLRSLWYLTRSRILLTLKHKPWAFPTVCASIAFAALRMLFRRLRSRIMHIGHI